MADPEDRARLRSLSPRGPVDPIDAARGWLRSADGLSDADMSIWTARIGGTSIRFRCTNPGLARASRARLLGPTAAPQGGHTLSFDLLETDRLGWSPPHAVVDRGGDPVSAARQLALHRLAALMPPADAPTDYPWVAFDPGSGRGVILVRTVEDLPPWAHGAPFALLFHLAFAWRGWRFLHAAALSVRDTGVILAGPSGSGKSATTLAGVTHGLSTAGDDYVLVEPRSEPVVWPVYRTLKQDPAGLIRAGRGDLAKRPGNWSGKVELDLASQFPGCIAPSLRSRSILLPQVAAACHTTIEPVAPTQAFSAIAPSVLSQLPGARMAGFAFLTRLTRSLPAYRLTLSADPREIADAVRDHLER